MSPTGQQFIDAFLEAYVARRASYPTAEWNRMLALAGTSDDFTRVMIAPPGETVVDRTRLLLADRFGYQLHRAAGIPYTIDAVFLGPPQKLDVEGFGVIDYAPMVIALEHEKFPTYASEMEKLFRLRCLLKVLIFYAWADPKRTTAVPSKALAWNKSHAEAKLRVMWQSAGAQGIEDSRTEYLLILGYQPEVGSELEWHWLTVNVRTGLAVGADAWKRASRSQAT